MRRYGALIIAASLTCNCVDTSLADELNWPDGALPSLDSGPPDARDGSIEAPNRDGGGAWHTDGFPDGSGDDTTPPWLVVAGCAGAEVSLGSLCVSTGPFGIAVRLWASEPVTASARIEGADAMALREAPSVEHHLLLAPLAPQTGFEVTVEVVDGASLSAVEGPFRVSTAQAVATVVINEVLFDPLGAEPHQEFVELYNLGADGVDLDGWSIADEGGEDPFTTPGALGPGAYALVVAFDYQPGSGGDPPPAPGAMMIRLAGAIGSQGLRNDGESVEVRDAEGRVVSLCPAPDRAPAPGVSLERVSGHGPDGDPWNWIPNLSESSTPGGRNGVSEPTDP